MTVSRLTSISILENIKGIVIVLLFVSILLTLHSVWIEHSYHLAIIYSAKVQTAQFARTEISLQECRYPEGDPAGDAFAFLTVRETGIADPVYRGWMIATAPALNPMDHPRYDVWVMRCTTS